MNKLFVMCGLPANSKSTYAIQLAVKESSIVVSTDNIRAIKILDEVKFNLLKYKFKKEVKKM